MAGRDSRPALRHPRAASGLCAILLLLLLVAMRAHAGSVALTWDPGPTPPVAGYKLYYGPTAGNYPSQIDVGNSTTRTVSGLTEGTTYHFAATAYNAARVESGFSNDVTATVPYSAPVAQFTGSPTSGAAPLTVAFSNSSTGTITSYAWNFGDSTTSSAASPSHVYSTPGTYTVRLTVSGPGGSNTQTRTNYVTVNSPAPVAQFTGSPTFGVSPLTVNFSNASTGSITSYAWNFGDSTTSSAASPSHLYATPGTYTVSLTVTGPGGSNTRTRANYVIVNPVAPVAQFTGSPTSGVAPLAVNFTSTSTGSITGYAWNFGDSTTSSAASPSHVYSTPGTYTVSLTVSGPGGSNTQTRVNYVRATSIPDFALYRRLVPTDSSPYYRFLLDFNFDHIPDAKIPFGTAGDVPLVGNMTPDGKTSLIVYRNGVWYIDTDRKGTADAIAGFGGVPGDVPLAANFSGPGLLDDLVIYRSGVWYVDRDLSGTADLTFGFGGVPGDVPLAADVNGDGLADLVIYRHGTWYIDTNRNGTADMIAGFGGMSNDVPLLFDWDGDGKADLCIFRDGIWYVSTKRDGVADVTFNYGAAGDLPMKAGRLH